MSGGQAVVTRATAAVFVDGRRAGSAVLVGPRYLVTAAHVLQYQVSGRGESHPPALAEPGVRVSPHRAPTGRPEARAMRAQWAKRRG